jgi:hypothetical protein
MADRRDISERLAAKAAGSKKVVVKEPPRPLHIMQYVLLVFVALLVITFYVGNDPQRGWAIRGLVVAFIGLGVTHLVDRATKEDKSEI